MHPESTTCAVPTGVTPAAWHRGLTVLAIVSMFVGTRGLWTVAVTASIAITATIVTCYAAILALAILALSVRQRRTLRRVDAGALIIGIVLVSCAWLLGHPPTDESALTAQAAAELLRGHPIYGQPWPSLLTDGHIALTQTMSGGADYTYGYPPLTVLLTAVLRLAVPGLSFAAAATAVPTLALIGGTITLWLLLPVPWRSAATVVCLGFGLLPQYARHGYPAVLAVALLVPVVVRWHRIGFRPYRFDVVSAICLGAACATQQLPWFLVPFLLVGVYALRRGDRPATGETIETGARAGGGSAGLVVARYAGTALAAWLAINAFFLIRQPSAWFAGILTPMTQHAVPHGQGLIDISYYFTDGSGDLDFYSYASLALAVGLLVLYSLFLPRLGPAGIVLPWCVFFLSVRSQDGYFLLMTPLWLAVVATVPASAFAHAWRPLSIRMRHPTVRVAATALLLAPAIGCAAVAVSSPAPLDLTIVGSRTVHSGLVMLLVRVTNDTGAPLTPHFTFSNGQAMERYWLIRSGPSTLGGYAGALYEIETAHADAVRGPHGFLKLRVVTGTPMTISSTDVPRSDLP